MNVHTSHVRRPYGAALLVAGICTALATAASAESPNLDQIRRIINGEVIVEAGGPEEPTTEEFFLGQCKWSNRGRNMFWSLEPGYQLYLAGEDDDEFVELYITVLRQTKLIYLPIDGEIVRVRARIIEERELVDGELYEISRNYYMRCKATNDMFYFGEDVCFFEDDECVGDDGSWLAGRDDATPGIIMPARFLLGALYFQEHAPGIAEDRARHTAMSVDYSVPAGDFEDCVEVTEDSPLDDGATSLKVYAPGVGLIKDGPLELVSYGYVNDCDDAGEVLDDELVETESE